jgi:hypothetical protein
MNRTIYTELLRSEAIASTPPPERHTPLRQVALKLTRRGAMAAKAELANAALLAFIEILFDVDEDQNYANIDADGRILLPAPWGRNGSVHWGLRRSEQRALSWLLRRRMETEENPLFIYDDETRSWYVGRGYARRSALAYLKAFPVTVGEWRTAWRATGSTWGRQQLERE